MNTQKSDSYIRMFTALSGVRLVFSERELAFTLATCHYMSAVCLSSVCNIRAPTQAI